MRKIFAGALAAVALSWANGAAAADAAKERREAADATRQQARDEARETRSEAKQEAREARSEAKQEAGEARQKAGQAGERARGEAAQARAGAMGEDKKHPVFDGKNNFDVDGKVSQVSASSITIQREDLPEAKLHVSKNTKIELDGESASVQELKRGQDVKASFNLQGDRAEAVEIKAEKLEEGDRKEMREQQRETQKEMGERQRETQQQR